MHISDRLQYLWQQYVDDSATQAELEELTALLNNPIYNEEAKSWLLESLQKAVPLQTHNEERLQNILRKIRKEDVADRLYLPYKESMADRKSKKIRMAWWAAAAILIVAVAIGFLVTSSKNEKQDSAVIKNESIKNDLAPGGNKAILTLADGTSIVLDSASEGALAQQGTSNIVKLANGKIAYETLGTSVREVLMNTMSTPRGGQYKLRLPDGTDVWLNAASSITYPTAFINGERNVSVTGEVYFEVAKDKSKPFHVTVKSGSSDMKIEVLGTHFNINAYDDESSIKTTLLEGSVKVALGAESSLLKPGQQSVVQQNKSTNNIAVLSNVNLDEVIAWKDGYFQFNRADIKTVMRQIARWYDVEVVYEGAIPKDKFVGDLPMDANASQVLRTLEKVQVHFRIEGKKIIVTP